MRYNFTSLLRLICANILFTNLATMACHHHYIQDNPNLELFWSIFLEPTNDDCKNNIHGIQEAIKDGANINEIFYSYLDTRKKDPDTLLARAVEEDKDIKIIICLIELGANINEPLARPTIHRAKSFELIKALIAKQKADLNIKDEEGVTAQEYIARQFKSQNFSNCPLKKSIITPANKRHSRSLSDTSTIKN